MAYTISESDYFSPDPEYDAYLGSLLARIRHRGSARGAGVPDKSVDLWGRL